MAKGNVKTKQQLEKRLRELRKVIGYRIQEVTPTPIDEEFGISTGNFIHEVCIITDEQAAKRFIKKHPKLSSEPILGVTSLAEAEEIFQCQRALEKFD